MKILPGRRVHRYTSCFSDKVLLRSYKRLTLSLPRVTLDFDYVYVDFTLSNARRFYSSKGDALGVKGLTSLLILVLMCV